MNLRNVKDYHNRYEKSLQEYGFTRQGNAYWRVYGDSIFQAICFHKIEWRCRTPEGSVEILASLFSLAKPESCILRLHDNIQDMDEEDWEISSNINLQWCCENVLGMRRENLGKEAWTDLMIKECMRIFQKSDTAEGAYESLKTLNPIEKSNRWNLPSPEIRTEEMYWLAIFAQKYDACRVYIDFNRQLNLLGIKESIQRDDPSEKSRLEEIPGVIGQWKREKKRLYFIEEHSQEFLEAKEYTKTYDVSSGMNWPECFASPMAYYMIQAGKYEKVRDFLKLWEDDEEYEWENYFQEDCNRISEIYEHVLNGDTEFAKQCLEKNYRENRELYEKIK